jgi:pimeloyl-ACP methyl ester carboxylesterase
MKRALILLAAGLLTAVAVVTVAGLAYHPADWIPEGLAGRFLDAGPYRLRVEQRGGGPDVLLIHGCPGSIEDWEPVFAALTPRYRVTAFDRPGQGYSRAAGSRFDHSSSAEAASALIAALGLAPVVVVGHSYGGPTALSLSLRHPEQVRSVVVVDSTLYRPSRAPGALYRLLAPPGFGTGLARLVASSIAPRRIRDGLAKVYPDAPPGFVERRLAIWSQPRVAVTVARENLSMAASLAALSRRYRELARPLYIVSQQADPAHREEAIRLHEEVPGSELLLLSDTGHYIQFQTTAELAAVIERAAAASSR